MVYDFINKTEDAFKDKKFTGVYGIPRGGMVLAILYSHKTGIPLLLAPHKDCLIIDDIADTGETLLHYSKKGYTIATMYYHQQSKVKPDYYYEEKGDKWIVYPWEIGNEGQ